MGEMRKKRYPSNTRVYNLKPYIEDFFSTRYKLRDELKNSPAEAPAMNHAVSLGQGTLTNGKAPVYLLTVPGYVYRRITGTNVTCTSGTSGIILASSPSNMAGDTSRLVYTAASNEAANNMTVIPTGSSTYMYLMRSNSCNFEYLFAPTVYAAASGIHPKQYAIKVGEIDNCTTGSNYYDGIFNGDWDTLSGTNATFVKMCGYYFKKVSKMSFVADADKAEYLNVTIPDIIRDVIGSVSENHFFEEDIQEVIDMYKARLIS